MNIFKYDRSLLTGLCQGAYRSLLTFLRETVGLESGVPGVVMAIHTFGENTAVLTNSLGKFHPHLHAIVTDGLFRDTGIQVFLIGVKETRRPSTSCGISI